MQQVNIICRWQPRDVEILQAPQVETLSNHRVYPTEEGRLLVAFCSEFECKVLHFGVTGLAVWTCQSNNQSANNTWASASIENLLNLLAGLIGLHQRAVCP